MLLEEIGLGNVGGRLNLRPEAKHALYLARSQPRQLSGVAGYLGDARSMAVGPQINMSQRLDMQAPWPTLLLAFVV